MANTGLIFIPDISGFTRFINENEIEHSRVIIQELLEVLINNNQIGLEISEIEGDAILFYKYGDMPTIPELFRQVEKMFCSFHRHLANFERRRICQCAACKSASSLTLKVVSHYGEFTSYNVKTFSKLLGKDIIVAHQLLKNDIENHEYWLVTDNLAGKDINNKELPHWVDWSSSSKSTETGTVAFQYTQLSPLKNTIGPEPLGEFEIRDKVKMISLSREYDFDMDPLFYTALDFNARSVWQVGLKKAEPMDNSLPHVGTKHRCILEKETEVMVTSTFNYQPGRIAYSETNEKKQHGIYLTFEKISSNKTRLTLDLYIRNSFIMITVFRLFMKKKMEKMFQQSLENLDNYMKSVIKNSSNLYS